MATECAGTLGGWPGQIVVGTEKGTVTFYDTREESCVVDKVLNHTSFPITAVTAIGPTMVAAGDGDGVVRIYISGSIVGEFRSFGAIVSIERTEGGGMTVVSGGGEITVFEKEQLPTAVPSTPSALGERGGGGEDEGRIDGEEGRKGKEGGGGGGEVDDDGGSSSSSSSSSSEQARSAGGVEDVLSFAKAKKKEYADSLASKKALSPDKQSSPSSPSLHRRGSPTASDTSPPPRASPAAAGKGGASEGPRPGLAVSPMEKPSRGKIEGNKKSERAKLAELNSGGRATGDDDGGGGLPHPPHALSKPSLNSSLAYQADVVNAAARKFDATLPTEPLESLRFASDMATNVPGDARIYSNLESVDARSVQGGKRAEKATTAAYMSAMKGASMGEIRGVDEETVGVGVRGGGKVEGEIVGRGEAHRRRTRRAF